MPISGLVITLSDEPILRKSALDRLASDARLTLGEIQGNRLPVVADTATIREGTHLVREELPDIEGVIFIDIVSVDFSDVDASAEPEKHEEKRRRESV